MHLHPRLAAAEEPGGGPPILDVQSHDPVNPNSLKHISEPFEPLPIYQTPALNHNFRPVALLPTHELIFARRSKL